VQNGELQASVPAGAREEIAHFKDALADAVDAYIRCQTAPQPDAKQIEQGLAGVLRANRPEERERTVRSNGNDVLDHVYGRNLKVSVRRPENHPQWLAVKLSFSIMCGSDSMLLVYDRSEGKWRRIVRWQSDPYARINGAFGDFLEYAAVPRKNGAWAVVAAHGTTWCTSIWSGFSTDLIAPADDQHPQHVFFHTQEGYVRENAPAMRATKDGFLLRTLTGSLDANLWAHPEIFHYRVSGDRVQRIQPVATNPRDFVDEWLQAKWSDATRWSTPENKLRLKVAHERIAALRNPMAKDTTSFTYGPVRACAGNIRRFQVELDQDQGAPMYFGVLRDNATDTFLMLSASERSDARCTQKIMEKTAAASQWWKTKNPPSRVSTRPYACSSREDFVRMAMRAPR